MESNVFVNSFTINRINKTNSKEYIQALNIYDRVTPHEIKTNSNEITKMLNEAELVGFQLLGFTLKYNDKISGLAILTYLEESRTILIEYLALENAIRNNASFLSYMDLLRSYIDDINLETAYWVVEISNKDYGSNIDKESRLFRKLLFLDGFGKLNAPYKTLPIELDNFESSFDANLYIQGDDSISNISQKTYLQIVKSIHNYSIEWFKFFNVNKDLKQFEEKVYKIFIDLESTLKNTNKIYIEYSNISSLKNKDYEENTSKNLPSEKKMTQKQVVTFSSLGLVLAMILIFIMNQIFDFLGIKMSEISSIISSVFTIIFTPIVSLFIGKKKL